jgi:hypothetical protein
MQILVKYLFWFIVFYILFWPQLGNNKNKFIFRVITETKTLFLFVYCQCGASHDTYKNIFHANHIYCI